MKIALVYDRVNKWGGAEQVLCALHEIWPEAPLYTAVYHPQTAPWANRFEVRTSWLNRLPFLRTRHEWLPTVTAWAFSQFDFSKFDVVLSITSAEAKHIVPPDDVLHVCYCLTPTRYLWSHAALYQSSGLSGKVLKWVGPLLRGTDFEAAQKINHFVAISNTVATRVKKYYRRSAEVIYPPVSTPPPSLSGDQSSLSVSSPFYLVVSRLVAYKRVDLAIQACNQLQAQLVIIGSGNEETYLKSMAGPTIHFLGQLTEPQVFAYYDACRAVIFPTEEDFGLVPVEAQARGKSVIAYAKGGARETIIADKTGVFFTIHRPASLCQAIGRLETLSIDPNVCKKQAGRFDKGHFQQRIKTYIEQCLGEYQKTNKVV